MVISWLKVAFLASIETFLFYPLKRVSYKFYFK